MLKDVERRKDLLFGKASNLATATKTPLFDPPQPSHIISKSYENIRKHASDKEPARVGAKMVYRWYLRTAPG